MITLPKHEPVPAINKTLLRWRQLMNLSLNEKFFTCIIKMTLLRKTDDKKVEDIHRFLFPSQCNIHELILCHWSYPVQLEFKLICQAGRRSGCYEIITVVVGFWLFTHDSSRGVVIQFILQIWRRQITHWEELNELAQILFLYLPGFCLIKHPLSDMVNGAWFDSPWSREC